MRECLSASTVVHIDSTRHIRHFPNVSEMMMWEFTNVYVLLTSLHLGSDPKMASKCVSRASTMMFCCIMSSARFCCCVAADLTEEEAEAEADDEEADDDAEGGGGHIKVGPNTMAKLGTWNWQENKRFQAALSLLRFFSPPASDYAPSPR